MFIMQENEKYTVLLFTFTFTFEIYLLTSSQLHTDLFEKYSQKFTLLTKST